MFNSLKNKWKVNTLNLVLILLTFALGGSTCARLAKWLLEQIHLQNKLIYWTLYVIGVTVLWPICVVLISIPTGQFRFFSNYIKRIGAKLFGRKKNKPSRIAIFASGNGSNAKNIIDYSKINSGFEVALLVCNNPEAKVLDVAKEFDIQSVVISNDDLKHPEELLEKLLENNVEWIVLAGFLRKIPLEIIQVFPGKIINIHPALLPEFGGKGMYGSKVHQAVIESGKKETGITIHYVDEHYDNGDIIFSAKCEVTEQDTPETVQLKVHQLEFEHYPRIINHCLQKQTVR